MCFPLFRLTQTMLPQQISPDGYLRKFGFKKEEWKKVQHEHTKKFFFFSYFARLLLRIKFKNYFNAYLIISVSLTGWNEII